MQIAIKTNRNKKDDIKNRPEEVIGFIGLDDTFEVLAEHFAKILGIAISVYRDKHWSSKPMTSRGSEGSPQKAIHKTEPHE